MIRKSLNLSVVIGAALAGPVFAAEPDDCRQVVLSDVGWTDITATTSAARQVLEGLGYEVDVQVLSVPVTFEALSQGDLDVFLLQGQPLRPGAPPSPETHRLYSNELVPSGTLRLTDVTAGSGLDAKGYGMGVAAGDDVVVRTVGGSGLGLSISLEDARLHGGWLQVWGLPGQGAQFRLTLPMTAGTELTSSPLPLRPTIVRRPGGAS